MGIKVHVTEKHITKSARGNAYACMVHDALEDQLQLRPSGIECAVVYDNVRFRQDGRELVIAIPASVGEKIEKWDQMEDPEPFDFNFNLPDDWRERLSDGTDKTEEFGVRSKKPVVIS